MSAIHDAQHFSRAADAFNEAVYRLAAALDAQRRSEGAVVSIAQLEAARDTARNAYRQARGLRLTTGGTGA